MTKYILSVDGGGIRGIIPAIILAEIEKRSRKKVAEIFDLVAGTSTGGIVVAGLCKKDNQGNPQYSYQIPLLIEQIRNITNSFNSSAGNTDNKITHNIFK